MGFPLPQLLPFSFPQTWIPENQNAFRHGLAGIAQRRADGVLNPQEQSIREEILCGLLADKDGAAQISTTAMRVLAEIIASDVSLLVSLSINLQRFGWKRSPGRKLSGNYWGVSETTGSNKRRSADSRPATTVIAERHPRSLRSSKLGRYNQCQSRR